MKKLMVIISLLFLSVACTKQDRENTIISQEASIDKYLSNLQGATIVRNGGSNRAVMQEGKAGTEAAMGDSLYIRYAGYTFSNGKGELFVTNEESVAVAKNFPMQESPYKLELGRTDLVSGLESGLVGVKEGEYCYIVFSAKYGYNNTQVANIPKLTPLFYEIWVDRVIK